LDREEEEAERASKKEERLNRKYSHSTEEIVTTMSRQFLCSMPFHFLLLIHSFYF
jgi:hypothetical protein